MLTESKHLSKIIWGAAVVLLIATIIVPNVDFSLQVDSPRADATPDPFDERVTELEAKIGDGRFADADADDALRLAAMIKARALTEAGPMTVTEIVWTIETIEEFQPQIAAQPDAASRETLRNHRNDLIADELPRLDRQKALSVLDEKRALYRDTFGVDPASLSEI